jgi:hypothetical protein
VGNSVLPGIEVREFVLLLLSSNGLGKSSKLFGCNFASISSGHVSTSGHGLRFSFDAFIYSSSSSFRRRCGGLLSDRCRLNIIQRLSKLEVDVCFNTTDLVVGLALQDVNGIVYASVLHIDGVSFVESSIIG